MYDTAQRPPGGGGPVWVRGPLPAVGPDRRGGGPARWWYPVGVAVLVTGIVSFGLLFHGLLTLQSDAIRVAVAGSAELRLDHPGEYMIAYESPSVAAGENAVPPGPPAGLTLVLHRVDTGDPVVLRRPAGETTYLIDGTAGRVVALFTIERPGDYVLESGHLDGSTASDGARLAVGPNTMRFASLEIAVGFPAAFAGITILIVVVARRSIARRRV